MRRIDVQTLALQEGPTAVKYLTSEPNYSMLWMEVVVPSAIGIGSQLINDAFSGDLASRLAAVGSLSLDVADFEITVALASVTFVASLLWQVLDPNSPGICRNFFGAPPIIPNLQPLLHFVPYFGGGRVAIPRGLGGIIADISAGPARGFPIAV